MDESMKKALIVGAGAVAGGWGGILIAGRLSMTYGLPLGRLGTVAGAAIGAMVGASVCKKLIAGSGDLEGEFEIEMPAHEEAA